MPRCKKDARQMKISWQTGLKNLSRSFFEAAFLIFVCELQNIIRHLLCHSLVHSELLSAKLRAAGMTSTKFKIPFGIKCSSMKVQECDCSWQKKISCSTIRLLICLIKQYAATSKYFLVQKGPAIT